MLRIPYYSVFLSNSMCKIVSRDLKESRKYLCLEIFLFLQKDSNSADKIFEILWDVNKTLFHIVYYFIILLINVIARIITTLMQK